MLKEARPGVARLRAGCLVAGNTGTALEGASSDVAFVQPTPRTDEAPVPDGGPLLVAAYLTGSPFASLFFAAYLPLRAA